jgi:lysozyme family protein
MDFDTAIGRVLSHEGGYVFNSKDPGGETKYGISKRSYPDVDIKSLTWESACALYRRDFWDPCVSLVSDSALVFQMLDAAINHGMKRATKFLQAALGVAADGVFGRDSHRALATADIKDVHLLYLAERFEFWCDLETFSEFGRGWTRRGAQDLRYLAQDN